MKEFDRVKDGDEYMYTIDGEPALWGDEEAFGLVRDWEKRYEDSEVITNMQVFEENDRVVDEHHVVYTKDGKHLLNCLDTFSETEYAVREGLWISRYSSSVGGAGSTSVGSSMISSSLSSSSSN